MSSWPESCVLHIGAPKTGSTALQAFLTANRDALMRHGCCYPEVSLRGFGHHDLAFLVGGGYPHWATTQERTLESLQCEFADSFKRAPKAVLSSENFYLQPAPEATLRLLTKAGVPSSAITVVVYIRRQDEAHLAWYNQAVKAQGYAGSLEDSIGETLGLWDYDRQLQPWADTFGAERLVVRIFDLPSLKTGDIRHDFLEILGLPPDDFAFDQKPVNTGLNADLLAFQRELNRLPLSPQEKRLFHKDLMALSRLTAGTGLFNDSPTLTAARRREILASYEAANERLAKRLGREKLFEPPETEGDDTGGSAVGDPVLSIDKLATIIGWLLIQRERLEE